MGVLFPKDDIEILRSSPSTYVDGKFVELTRTSIPIKGDFQPDEQKKVTKVDDGSTIGKDVKGEGKVYTDIELLTRETSLTQQADFIIVNSDKKYEVQESGRWGELIPHWKSRVRLITINPILNQVIEKILFYSDRASTNIYTKNSDGNDDSLTKIPNTSDAMNPDYSSDNLLIVYEKDNDIFTIDIEGNNDTPLTVTDNNVLPKWDNDGTKIFFSRDISGSERNVYSMDSDGSNQTGIVESVSLKLLKDISNDSTKILYEQLNTTITDIYIADSDGSNAIQLTDGNADVDNLVNFKNPVFNNDGSKIFYNSDEDDTLFEIFNMDSADGDNKTKLATESIGYLISDIVGTKIAYVESIAGVFQINTMQTDGTDKSNVSEDFAGNDLQPRIISISEVAPE